MSAALLVVDDGTASTPPRALHPYRKTLSREHRDVYYGLLDEPVMLGASAGYPP